MCGRPLSCQELSPRASVPRVCVSDLGNLSCAVLIRCVLHVASQRVSFYRPLVRGCCVFEWFTLVCLEFYVRPQCVVFGEIRISHHLIRGSYHTIVGVRCEALSECFTVSLAASRCVEVRRWDFFAQPKILRCRIDLRMHARTYPDVGSARKAIWRMGLWGSPLFPIAHISYFCLEL